MIIWAGRAGTTSTYYNDLSSYTPGRIVFLYQRP